MKKNDYRRLRIALQETRRTQLYAPLTAYMQSELVETPNGRITATRLYDRYLVYVAEHHPDYPTLSWTAFGINLGARYAKTRSSTGVVYHGIMLRETPQ